MTEYEIKVKKLKEDISYALSVYTKYTPQKGEIPYIKEEFIKTLAEDSLIRKYSLREMLRKHPNWDEENDCVIVEGMIHPKQRGGLFCEKYFSLITEGKDKNIISPDTAEEALEAMYFFLPLATGGEDSLKKISPHYKGDRKKSRTLKQMFQDLGLDKLPSFEVAYATMSDVLNARPKKVNLIVSVNPAHFLTMSNPKGDTRGNMLVSCCSLNNAEFSYNNGCTGYARDSITMIAFTVDDINNKESWFNRKTSRQLFMYKPESGFMLQSRMYNSAGGTLRKDISYEDYLRIMQDLICTCEKRDNKWETVEYLKQDKCIFTPHIYFGGYPDWRYREFPSFVSIRKDNKPDDFEVGAAGICWDCGMPITCPQDGVFCEKHTQSHCELCGRHTEKLEYTEVFDEWRHICEHCREEFIQGFSF